MSFSKTFPTSKIKEVEIILSERTGVDVSLFIKSQKDYNDNNYETLITANLLPQMSKLTNLMWESYIIEVQFKVLEDKIIMVADAKYAYENGGSNGQKLHSFSIDL